jgi:hypothetical protein
MVNLSDYSYIFIFFESVLTEGDQWLTIQIQEKGIPFCLVRSKVDKDVESRKVCGFSEEIRNNSAFVKAVFVDIESLIF